MKDKDLFDAIKVIFDDKIPFNKVLGLRVHSLEYDEVMLKFVMRDELIGNYMRSSLHGVVIS